MSNDDTAGGIAGISASMNVEKHTDVALSHGTEAKTVTEMAGASVDKTQEGGPAEAAGATPPAQETTDEFECRQSMIWIVVQWSSIALLCASIIFSIANFLTHGTLFHVIQKLGLPHFTKRTENGEIAYTSTDYLLYVLKDNWVFSCKCGFKSLVAILSTPKTPHDRQPDSLAWPDVAYYVSFAMGIALVAMLSLVTGRQRCVRGNVFGLVIATVQLPVISLLVDLLLNHKQLFIYNEIGSLASPLTMLALYGTTCAVQLIVGLCAFVGVLLNGRPAAGYFTSYYHVRKPPVTV